MADIKAYRGYNSSFYGYFTLSMTGGIYLVGHCRYDFPIPSAPHPIQKPPRAPKHLRSEDSTPPATWMSREVSKWVITWYNLPTNGVYWGYNPLANLLQTLPKSSYKWEERCFHPQLTKFLRPFTGAPGHSIYNMARAPSCRWNHHLKPWVGINNRVNL